MKFSSAILLFICFLYQCSTNSDKSLYTKVEISEKQRGAHVFRLNESSDLKPLKDANIEWLTFVSWGFQDNHISEAVTHHNGDSTEIQISNTYWKNRIDAAHIAGFKIFFKPHLWLHTNSNEKWRSDIFPTNDKNWEKWKNSYREFILRYAKIAEETGVEMFCVGTEFTKLTTEKPEFWEELIDEARAVYSGKLTYAANWYEEYNEVRFWDKLDYIGIQAYFPLVDKEYPNVEEISNGWDKYLPEMLQVSEKHNRSILFTEMGYKSTASSGIKPWEWVENHSELNNEYSLETQSNCYAAFFSKIWNQPWFAGVHLWQFRGDFVLDATRKNTDFTPQGKPALDIITKGFSH